VRTDVSGGFGIAREDTDFRWHTYETDGMVRLAALSLGILGLAIPVITMEALRERFGGEGDKIPLDVSRPSRPIHQKSSSPKN
jgi:hypothetical protein